MRHLTTICRALFTLGSLLSIASCGSPREEVGTAPVAELNGSWLMINRSVDCDSSYIRIGAAGIYRVYENGQPRKYASIQRFTLEPGKVSMNVANLSPADDLVLTLVFSVGEKSLRLLEILSEAGESFRSPDPKMDQEKQAYRKAMFRVTENRFALDRCPGS